AVPGAGADLTLLAGRPVDTASVASAGRAASGGSQVALGLPGPGEEADLLRTVGFTGLAPREAGQAGVADQGEVGGGAGAAQQPARPGAREAAPTRRRARPP